MHIRSALLCLLYAELFCDDAAAAADDDYAAAAAADVDDAAAAAADDDDGDAAAAADDDGDAAAAADFDDAAAAAAADDDDDDDDVGLRTWCIVLVSWRVLRPLSTLDVQWNLTVINSRYTNTEFQLTHDLHVCRHTLSHVIFGLSDYRSGEMTDMTDMLAD